MNGRFNFKKLDDRTRKLMVEEIQTARASDQLYFSKRFNPVGMGGWPDWLLQAAQANDEHWLAYQLDLAGAMKGFETREKPKGGYTTAHVRHDASEMLADGQFNRFYMAAICRRAIEDGIESITIYRAKIRQEPRQESMMLEGTARDPKTLLTELRMCALSLKCDLLKPGSGLSVDC